ncbi:MAG: hypothetical protein QXK17_04660 [Metallosphaera sp.]
MSTTYSVLYVFQRQYNLDWSLNWVVVKAVSRLVLVEKQGNAYFPSDPRIEGPRSKLHD